MKRNLLPALILLLLGAALADWLSAGGAQAQALPPSGGGTSYTHPSAISLPNGIDSQDGGTFVGRVRIGTSGFTPHASGVYGLAVESKDEAPAPLLIQGKAGVAVPSIYWAPTDAAAYAGYMEYNGALTGCWGFTRTGGFGSSLIFCPYLGSGDTMAVIAGHPTASTYGVRLQSYNGSALETAFETVGGWARLPKTNAGAPAATDCDADAEGGRWVRDTTNNRLYICNGATRGWDYVALTD